MDSFIIYLTLFNIGNEYICCVEYAPSQSRPRRGQESYNDPKVNSIEQGEKKKLLKQRLNLDFVGVNLDPEYQTFVTNMNAPLSATEILPNAETMLEEIEKKQRDCQGKIERAHVK